jgi:hypothetical protein
VLPGRDGSPWRRRRRGRVFAALRRGSLPRRVLDQFGELEDELVDLLETSPLPVEPDRQAGIAFVARAYRTQRD